MRSRGSGPAVGTVGGGVRLASEVRCEQVGVTIGDFWGARWLTRQACVSLTCANVSERDGSQPGSSLKVAVSDTTVRDPPDFRCGEPASGGTSSATVARGKNAGSAENAPRPRVGVR